MRRIRLWDLPTRVFHWALVAAVAGAFVTENAGRMDWHAACGLTVLGLLVFRLAWGVIGGHYARFTQFVPGPRAIGDYLRGRWHGAGHNPLGALSVLAMLGALFAQAAAGLFANDDSTFSGPLASLVTKAIGDEITALHHLLAGIIAGLVLLHIAAIIFYTRVRGDQLVRPMITGWKDRAPDDAPDSRGGGPLAFVIAVLIAGGAVYVASGALPPPPPPPEVLPPTPSW